MQLTSEGYRQLREELAARLEERLTVAEEIRRAAADKDFTENSPLDAAREHQGHLEARIRELEATVQGAVVLDGRSRPGGASVKVGVGSRVVLRQQDTGREVSYLLVEPREADPANGKLSIASPVGRALLNRNVGQEVEVATPRGPVRYLIARLGG
ncbi:MAG: transcription elongation factor GreA [Chloroflexi bacterium]|nr:transcription elongation factor GreA [Chloroflexota bacterium]